MEPETEAEKQTGAKEPATGPGPSVGPSPPRPIVANWNTHRVLQRLFADWATLWLPSEEASVPRWMSVALTSGACLAKWDAAAARGVVGSLELDRDRSDRIYRDLLAAYAAADRQNLAVPVRVRAAICDVLCRHSRARGGGAVIWERGIEAIHSYAAAAIAWGVRAFQEDELLAGSLLGYREPTFAHEQWLVFHRLIELWVLGPDDPRSFLELTFACAYPDTPIEGQIIRAYAAQAFDRVNHIVSTEGLPHWAIEGFRSGQDLVREEPQATRDIIAELRRVGGEDAYEDQLGLSRLLLRALGHPGPIDGRRIYRELLPIIEERWPSLLLGHTYATHLRLWWRVFDQAFWTGLFAELIATGNLPPQPSPGWPEGERAKGN